MRDQGSERPEDLELAVQSREVSVARVRHANVSNPNQTGRYIEGGESGEVSVARVRRAHLLDREGGRGRGPGEWGRRSQAASQINLGLRHIDHFG